MPLKSMHPAMADRDAARHPVTLHCPCGRTVASPYLDVAELRTLTGFTDHDGLDVCGECASRLRGRGVPGLLEA